MLLGNSPNPFRSSTALRFELPAAGPYELDVFDVAGKRVSHFRGVGQPGANIVPWNGRDEQGRDTKAGVYYYRLTAGSSTASRKVVRLQ